MSSSSAPASDLELIPSLFSSITRVPIRSSALLHQLPPLLLLLIAFLAYWTLWTIYTFTFHPLAHIPGPFWASVSRTWYMYHVWHGDMEAVQLRLHKVHGPLVRIAPNEVACSCPSAIRTIYRASGGLDKTDFYPIWNSASFSPHRDAFTETSEAKHARRRRIVTHVYSLANVLQSEEYIDRCSDIFVKRLGEYADAGAGFQFGDWLQWFSFDVIGELYFGKMFGFMAKGEDHCGWVHSLDLLMPFLCLCAVAPVWVRPIILGSSAVVPGALKALKAVNTIESAARACVAKRLRVKEYGGEELRVDMLEQLFQIYKEKGEKLDFRLGDIEQEAYIGLLAGSDTTAIAFRAIFYHLLKHPSIYAALQSEIDAAASSPGKLSTPIRYSEAKQLPLLHAVIKESLRLHPSAQLTMGRISPSPGGLELPDGGYIPPGYWVGINSYVCHRNVSAFGPDAEKFRPGRWLEGTEESRAALDRSMLHFGAGSRTCVGKNISLAEIYKLVPEVLRHFRLEWADAEKTVWETQNLWFCKQELPLIRVVRRG